MYQWIANISTLFAQGDIMSAQPQYILTPSMYLAWEREQALRHEYINGEVFAMTGASRKHNLICVNIAAALHTQLRGRPCEVYNNDMRVKINTAGAYTYPDIVVVCDHVMFEDDDVDTLLNPVILIEILSASTERYDRGAKFGYYRSLPSVQEYLLVSQDTYRIEHYVRQNITQWLFTDYRDLNSLVPLIAIKCELPLQIVYERIAQ